MLFNVTMSNGRVYEVRSDDARGAFRIAQKEYGIGTFVKKIAEYDYGDVYYIGGNFVDPIDAKKDALNDAGIDTILTSCISALSFERRREVYIGGQYYWRIFSLHEDGSITCSILDYRSKAEIMNLKVTITAENDEPQVHKFENRVCVGCKQSLFDLDNPNGICEG